MTTLLDIVRFFPGSTTQPFGSPAHTAHEEQQHTNPSRDRGERRCIGRLIRLTPDTFDHFAALLVGGLGRITETAFKAPKSSSNYKEVIIDHGLRNRRNA